jgi:hypothetical protein
VGVVGGLVSAFFISFGVSAVADVGVSVVVAMLPAVARLCMDIGGGSHGLLLHTSKFRRA